MYRMVVATFVAVAVGAALATTGAAETTHPEGCPAGWDRLSVVALEALGPYRFPRVLDEAGNNNGFVCGHIRPDAVRDAFCRFGIPGACALQALDLSAYQWKDDDNPAGD